MNQVLNTIYQRRAVRKYKDIDVDSYLLEQVIDAGRMAPSAINKQPWKFYILNDKRLIESFSKETGRASFKGLAHMGLRSIAKTLSTFIRSPHNMKFFNQIDFIFHGAPVVVFITAPKDNEWASIDIGMCAQNMMLAAKSLGLESCPVGLAKFVEGTYLYPLLKISKKDHVLLAIVIGYGDETPESKERKKDNVFYIKSEAVKETPVAH